MVRIHAAGILRKRIVHVVGNLSRSSGGPSHTVTGIAHLLADNDQFDVHIVTQESPDGDAVDVPSSVSLVTIPEFSLPHSLIKRPLLGALRRLNRDVHIDVVINHGLWTPMNLQAARFASQAGSKLVIQPHGMLSPWALNHHRYRKVIAGAAFQWKDLKRADALLATSEAEYRIFRCLGLRQPIMISPNGIKLPKRVAPLKKPGTQMTALFLGRLHPVKGLDNLLRSWKRINPCNWELLIAGPSHGSYQAHLEGIVRKESIPNVEFLGPVFGSEKESLFRRANLFILPSHTENFGVVIAEALSHGIPVITTTGTPWEDLIHRGCGWWVEPNVTGLTEALQEAVALPHSIRMAMGTRAALLAEEFDWKRVSEGLIDFIEWLACGEVAPRNLRLL
ncbi:MAG: glycosyltransferase [Betaproteobacteria bacterium]